ncbi:MAG: hypothetical protein ACFB0E_17400 [Leptolyngbyaceae cyanobacterium]
MGDYQNSELFDMLNQARSATEKAERETIYQDVDRILFEEALRIPIVHPQPLLAQRTNVEGWSPSPFSNEPFTTVEKS